MIQRAAYLLRSVRLSVFSRVVQRGQGSPLYLCAAVQSLSSAWCLSALSVNYCLCLRGGCAGLVDHQHAWLSLVKKLVSYQLVTTWDHQCLGEMSVPRPVAGWLLWNQLLITSHAGLKTSQWCHSKQPVTRAKLVGEWLQEVSRFCYVRLVAKSKSCAFSELVSAERHNFYSIPSLHRTLWLHIYLASNLCSDKSSMQSTGNHGSLLETKASTTRFSMQQLVYPATSRHAVRK